MGTVERGDRSDASARAAAGRSHGAGRGPNQCPRRPGDGDRVGSDTIAESLAFFAAAMPEALLTRAVVVTAAGWWLRLATHREPLTLVPTFEDPDVPLALKAGHHVLIPEGPRSPARLPRVEVPAATAALEAAGVGGPLRSTPAPPAAA